MDLHDGLEVVRRRWVSVTIVALATIAVTAAATLVMTTKYTATTRLFFAVQGSKTTTDLAQGSSFAEKQMTSYAEAATSPLVLSPVIERLNLGVTPAQLADVVTATIPPQTVILQVSAVDPDPELAAAIANAVGDEVVDVVTNTLSPKQNGNDAVKVTRSRRLWFRPLRLPLTSPQPRSWSGARTAARVRSRPSPPSPRHPGPAASRMSAPSPTARCSAPSDTTTRSPITRSSSATSR